MSWTLTDRSVSSNLTEETKQATGDDEIVAEATEDEAVPDDGDIVVTSTEAPTADEADAPEAPPSSAADEPAPDEHAGHNRRGSRHPIRSRAWPSRRRPLPRILPPIPAPEPDPESESEPAAVAVAAGSRTRRGSRVALDTIAAVPVEPESSTIEAPTLPEPDEVERDAGP